STPRQQGPGSASNCWERPCEQMGNIVPTLRIPMSLWTFLILSLLFPAQGSKAAQRTAAQAQSAGGQVAVTRLIVTVRDEGGGIFSGLATVTLQHLDS